jgi:hypothetical protein
LFSSQTSLLTLSLQDIRKYLLSQSATLVKEKFFKRTPRSTLEELTRNRGTLARYIVGKNANGGNKVSANYNSDGEDDSEPEGQEDSKSHQSNESLSKSPSFKNFKGIFSKVKKKEKPASISTSNSTELQTAATGSDDISPASITSPQLQRAKLLLGKLYI